MGRNLRNRLDFLHEPGMEEDCTTYDMVCTTSLVVQTMRKAQLKQRRHYNQRKIRSFEVGESVMARDYRKVNIKQWAEARIERRLGKSTYLCRLTTGEVWKRHVNQIISIGKARAGRSPREDDNTTKLCDRISKTNRNPEPVTVSSSHIIIDPPCISGSINFDNRTVRTDSEVNETVVLTEKNSKIIDESESDITDLNERQKTNPLEFYSENTRNQDARAEQTCRKGEQEDIQQTRLRQGNLQRQIQGNRPISAAIPRQRTEETIPSRPTRERKKPQKFNDFVEIDKIELS